MNKLLFIISLVSLLAIMLQLFNQPSPGLFVVYDVAESRFENLKPETAAKTKNSSTNVFLLTDFASHESTPEVHSAAAIELADNNIMAFWYGGTREGHKDVNIYKNTWHNSQQQWGEESTITTRLQTRDGTSRYIRKLGNPVVSRGPDDSIWLFYVSVSIGGWAGSAINLIISYDEGDSWSPAKRLITSPFLNISTLLKGSPIHYADGSIGLPVYHEFLGKFSELLRLDSSGNVIDKTRLSWGKTSLQPIIVPFTSTQALSMMRYHGSSPYRILSQYTNDSGLSWSAVEKTTLPNPNAGIHAIQLADGQLLLAFNNHEDEREDMTLAISGNQAKSWEIKKVIEKYHLKKPDNSKQFSYPWLLQTKNGNIHLLYTWHKSHIKHKVFNQQWLESTELPTNINTGGVQ
ncbi:MAG: exo-alpha-sialidase [Proteobacteria bacterium]|nr:exo-alpha-sialidase [Pseudomonadota bacterium]